MMKEKVEKSLLALREYCERENFKGYDPYDGLNSTLFQKSSALSKSRLARLICIQFFKRSPINLRPLCRVEKDFNPKGLGLFLSGYCNLYRLERRQEYLDTIVFLIKKLEELESRGWSGSCWGYNFDWQARAFFHPKYTPTVVASSFIGYSLLDAYEILNDSKLIRTARSICDFILNDLNKTYDSDGNFAFSYSPLDNTQVFNATLLASKVLSRTYYYTREEHLIGAAKKSIDFCIRHQNHDGSWPYGTLPYHQWIDSFHTGFNIESLREYQKYSADDSYDTNIEMALEYYLNRFFTAEGIPKYYHNQTYPIDIHAPAQLVVTLCRLGAFNKHKKIVESVLKWTIDNMQSSKGYFYFQKRRRYLISIPYIRWAQSWMFLSLSLYLRASTGYDEVK